MNRCISLIVVVWHSGRKDVPKSVSAVLDQKWAEVVTPNMGFKSYKDLRAAVKVL